MGWLSGWSKRIKLTIDNTKVDSALSNFPVLVHLSTSSGITSADVSTVFDELTSDTNRKKIAITTSDGTTQCYVEIEKWDDANEQAWLWVKAPSVSSSADTDLYLYYDSSQTDNTTYVGDTGDTPAQSVWDSNFAGVWHKNGTLDSTSKGNNITFTGASALSSGKVAGAYDYDGVDDRGVISDTPDLDIGTGDATLEAVVKLATSQQEDYAGIAGKGYLGGSLLGHGFLVRDVIDTGKIVYQVRQENIINEQAVSNSAHNNETWVGVAGRLDRSSTTGVQLLVDGVVQTTKGDGSAFSSINLDNSQEFTFGTRHDGSAYLWDLDGAVDEVRLSKIARTDAWLKATHHSNFDSLITFGSEEILGAEISDGAGIADQFDVSDLKGSITENSGIDDSFQASQQTIGSFTDGVGIGDTFSVQDMYAEFTDGVGINDQFAASSEGQFTDATGINDAFEFFRELIGSVQNDSGIDDSIIASKIFYQSISDSLNISGIASASRDLSISDSAQIYSALKWTWLKTISDSLTIEDAIDAIAGMVISEWLFFAESQNVKWKGAESASSILTIVDDPQAVKVFSDLLADGFSISDIAKSLVGIVLKEKLIASLALENTGKFQQNASDAIKFTDALPFGWDKVISDSLTISDTQVLRWLLLNVLEEQITISDTQTLLKVIPQSVADSIQLSSSVLLQQLLFSLVTDSLGFSVEIELDGELWECWVLNSSKFHPSVYSGYDFNSYAVYNNTAYGCKSDGIYKLSGDTDNGAAIKNGMILPETGFGSSRNKRFRKAYFGISGSSPSIKIETETGSKTFSISNAMASISRDLKGKKWTLTVADFDDLDFIKIIPIILTR